jgi:hypothetical protein
MPRRRSAALGVHRRAAEVARRSPTWRFSGPGRYLLWAGDSLGARKAEAKRLLLPAGRQYGQFERSLIAERVRAGMVRAKKQGRRLGRPEKLNGDLDALIPLIATGALSQRAAARRLGVSVSTLSRSLLRKGHPVSQPRPVVGASSGNVVAPGGSAAQASPA